MERNPALAASGVVAGGVALGSVLLATMVSPSFRWTGNALSDLGVAVLGWVFAAFLWLEADTRGERVVAVLLALTLAAMAGVAVFPQGTGPHLPMAGAFYLLVTVTIWADAVVVRGTEEGRRGAVAAWLGAANVAAWLLWAATGPVQRPGAAMPEIVGALVFALWILSTAIRLTRWEPAVNRSPAR